MTDVCIPTLEEVSLVDSREYSMEQVNEQFPGNTLSSVVEELSSEHFAAIRILSTKLGATVTLTGGIIRDSLLAKKPKDFDFVVSFENDPLKLANDPEATQKYIKSFEDFFGEKILDEKDSTKWRIEGEYGVLILAGEGFGVYKFRPAGSESVEIDISFPRTEGFGEGHVGGAKNILAQSNALLPFAQEVTRRDFTMNGLGLELRFDGNGVLMPVLLDYVGGLDDINNRVLRTIGDAGERLHESKDRVARALRFMVQYGLAVDDYLAQVMREMITPGVGYPGVFFETYPGTSKLVIPKATLAKNLLKGFSANPSGMLTALEDYGVIAKLFPHLTTTIVPTRSKAKLSVDPGTLDSTSEKNIALRKTEWEVAKIAVRTHIDKYPDASLEEIFFLLAIGTGVSDLTIPDEQMTPEAWKISGGIFQEWVRQNGLDTLPSNHSLRLNTALVRGWCEVYSEAVALFANEPSPEKLDEDQMSKFSRLFPNLLSDPYWRAVETRIECSPRATSALSQLPSVIGIMKKIEDTLRAEPVVFQEVVDGGQIVRAFSLQPSQVVGKLLGLGELSYYNLLLKHEEGLQLTVEDARRRVFARLLSSEILRNAWFDDFQDAISFWASNGEQNLGQRMILRVLERKAALVYLGETLEEAAAHETTEYQLQEHSLTGTLHKRAKGLAIHNEAMAFGDLFGQKLAEDPQAVLAWLEVGIKKKGSLVQQLFPEIVAMYRADQGTKYHSEGSVWVHTTLLFKRAEELGIKLTPELALAMLLHDIGKPPCEKRDGDKIMHYGHPQVSAGIFTYMSYLLGFTDEVDVELVLEMIENHDRFYDYQHHSISALEVRRYFPDGIDSPLAQLIRCDSAASIPGPGVSRDDSYIFDVLEEWGPLVQKEVALAPKAFDQALESELFRTLGKDRSALYEIYLTQFVSYGLIPDNLDFQLWQRYVMSSRQRAFRHVTGTIDGNALMNNPDQEMRLEGRQIGEYKSLVAGYLFQNGQMPDTDICSGFIRQIKGFGE